MPTLKEFLQSKKKVDVLCTELNNILKNASNPAFEYWEYEQKSNRAVLLESTSLVFSVVSHLETTSSDSRTALTREILDQLEVVDSELFFQSSMSLLRTANKAGEDSVDSMVVQDLVRELIKVSRDPLSKEARAVVRSYMSSEKPLYFIKNKLSAAQVGQIFTEITKETCPFREVVPKVILVPMEAIFKTTQMVTWLGDSSTEWISSALSLNKPEAPTKQPSSPVSKRKTVVLGVSPASDNLPSPKPLEKPESKPSLAGLVFGKRKVSEHRDSKSTAKASPKERESKPSIAGIVFGRSQVPKHVMNPSDDSKPKKKAKPEEADNQKRKDKKVKKDKKDKREEEGLKPTNYPPPQPNKENPGIEMFPVPSGRVSKPAGIDMGLRRIPPVRVNFQVHGNTPFRRMAAVLL